MTKIDLLGFGNEPKRIPVGQHMRTKLLVRSKGKCEKCLRSLDGVKPHIHHKDGDPKNNKMSNLKVLCPNCHSNVHDKPIKRKSKNNVENLLFGKPSKRNPLF
jgi:5-methylcytosine-specific restriction endonuclease McrA